MPDLRVFFRTAPASKFTGTVYRVCPALFKGNLVSMRGSFLYGARYNVRGYFGALYASLSPETARLEAARYFTVSPMGGFVEASIALRLNRVVDLTDRMLLTQAGIVWDQLVGTRFQLTHEIGLRAWESGIEGLLAPSAADPTQRNLAVFLDNHRQGWRVELRAVSHRQRIP